MQAPKRRRVAGVSPVDPQGHKKRPPITGGVQLDDEVIVQRSPMDCYRFWRDFENLPRFMEHIESIAVIDAQRSHWSVSGPGDSYVEWDAEIIADEPGQLISWRSLEGAQIDNAGSVHFHPEATGTATRVKVVMTYNPPAGVVGEFFAKLFGEEPARQLQDDLALFKTMLETHDVSATSGKGPEPSR